MLTSCDTAPVPASRDGHRFEPIDLCSYLTVHYEELLQQLTRRTGCRERATAALHDTWVRLHGHCGPPAVCSPKAFLVRMAYNQVIDQIRRDTQHSPVSWDVDAEDFDMLDPAPGLGAILDTRWLLRRLIEAIERLPRQRRAIFVAVRLEDLSQKEVAKRYGVTLGKVQGELRKAHAYCEQVLLET